MLTMRVMAKARASPGGEKVKGKGKGKAQKGEAMAKQLEHEAAKHEKRQERLQKMLEVAEGKGDEKAAGRIQSLMDKENNRYAKKQTRMMERQNKGDSGDGEEAVEEEVESDEE